MTRRELLHNLGTLSSGTIAGVIGSPKYAAIDRAIGNAILYAAHKAPDEEITMLDGFAGILSFLSAHKDEKPDILP